MIRSLSIDPRFLEPLESMVLALEMAEVPMLVFVGPGLDDYLEQTTAALGGTVLYGSQADFEAQALASLRKAGRLFVVIDRPLAGRGWRLVHAYLAARDVLGGDDAPLAEGFAAGPPHAEHRLVLLVDLATFQAHGETEQRALGALTTRIAVK